MRSRQTLAMVLGAMALSVLGAGCVTSPKTKAAGDDDNGRKNAPVFYEPKAPSGAGDQEAQRLTKPRQQMSFEEELAQSRQVSQELRRILSLRQRGETAALREEFSKRIAQDAGDLMAKLFQAWVDFPSENTGTQINALAKMNPDEPWLHTALARVYAQWPSFHALAMEEANKSLQISATFTPAMTVKADILRSTDQLSDAIAIYREVIAIDPKSYEAFLGLSVALDQTGDAPASRTALESALAIDDSDILVIKRYVELLLKTGETFSVVPYLDRLVAFDPSDLQLKLQRGNLHLILGDKVLAARDFEAFLAATPSAEVAEQLASIYRELVQPQDEIRALTAWIRFSEGATAANFRRLYELLRDDGDTEGAENYLSKAVDAAPDDMELRRLLASSQVERGDYLHAIETLRAAVAIQGDRVATAELKRLSKAIGLSAQHLTGDANRVYNKTFLFMSKALRTRRLAQKGTMAARIQIGEGGAVKSVEILRDTFNDQKLRALLHFTLLDAVISGGQPRAVTFELDFMDPSASQGKK